MPVPVTLKGTTAPTTYHMKSYGCLLKPRTAFAEFWCLPMLTETCLRNVSLVDEIEQVARAFGTYNQADIAKDLRVIFSP